MIRPPGFSVCQTSESSSRGLPQASSAWTMITRSSEASPKGSSRGSTSAEAEGPLRGQTATPCVAGISAIARSASSRKIAR